MARIVPNDALLIPPAAQQVFRGEIFDVYQWQQQLFDGSMATFEMLRRPDTVIFVGVIGEKLVFITDEQPNRPPITRLPGGRVDDGEDWLTAVQRESLEELGLRFADWRLVHVCQPVARIEWFVATYLATDLIAEEVPRLDPGERISRHDLSFAEARQFIMTSRDSSNSFLQPLFGAAHSLEAFKNLPAFQGKEVR